MHDSTCQNKDVFNGDRSNCNGLGWSPQKQFNGSAKVSKGDKATLGNGFEQVPIVHSPFLMLQFVTRLEPASTERMVNI